MLPKHHILLGFIFSIIVWILFPEIGFLNFSIIFLSSVLIDFDHYMFYVFRKRDLSLSEAYDWHLSLMGKIRKPIMMIFHSIEFILLITLLAFFYQIFIFILVGILFHSIADIIDMYYRDKLHLREFSLIRYLISDKSNYF